MVRWKRGKVVAVDIVLAIWAASCCLVLPGLLVSAPLLALGVRGIRRDPARRPGWIVGASLANALLTGATLAGAGLLVGFSIESEDAGAALEFLLKAGCGGGLLSGFVITVVILSLATRGAAEERAGSVAAGARHVDEARLEARARHVFVVSALLFVLGVATSLVGLMVAFSLGMISLALASVTVRPVASAFALAHFVALALSARLVGGSDQRRRMASGAAAVSALGVGVALLIATFGPGFFERLGRALASALTF